MAIINHPITRLWRRGNSHSLLMRMSTGAATRESSMENSMEVPKTLRTELPPHPESLSISQTFLKTFLCKDRGTPLFTSLQHCWRRPRHENHADDGIKKIWPQTALNYYLALGKGEPLPRTKHGWSIGMSRSGKWIRGKKPRTLWCHSEVGIKLKTDQPRTHRP